MAYKFNALLIFVILASSCHATISRGKRQAGRIVDGKNVTPVNKYPMMAAYGYKDNIICGATVLNRHYVLTAAHCLDDSINDASSKGFVVLGAYYLGKPNDSPTAQVIFVAEITRHVRYKDTKKGYFSNDIAVLRLKNTINFNDYVAPTNLPPPGWRVTNNKEEKAIAVGWGAGRDAVRPYPPDLPLQEVELPLHTTESCQREWLDYPITDNQVCLETTGGAGTCFGDSGGPLFIYNEQDDSHIQIGIVSYGSRQCGKADKFEPAVFTKLSKYVYWIEEVTRECDKPRLLGR